ncbi:hypothetical protein SAMN02745975_02837 [Geosporobacter subterraneus DSM 17957]|uniref:Uncharacterized protein n=1 Tax=Geosporobacter subterraneus DSM 17957 TaxID=1121919 RepID=A0A1M6M2J4_9FIRM|nr:hypothetical protein [Geosporobacter subterraneus]SHJ77655.1 hypothetical protein SAMN02745975_02837 [Geosporobacter subterraneus DSM 17957]
MPIKWYVSPYSEFETAPDSKKLYITVTRNTFRFNSYARDAFGFHDRVIIGVDEDSKRIFLMPGENGRGMAGFMYGCQYEVSARKIINSLHIAINKKYPARIEDGIISFYYEKEEGGDHPETTLAET